jgi:hypothetical protein
LYGIGFGSAQPAIQAFMINLAQPEKKGLLMFLILHLMI